MDETVSTLMTIVGPVILFGLLIWAARSRRTKAGEAPPSVTERATHANYEREEQRRRDGTDGL